MLTTLKEEMGKINMDSLNIEMLRHCVEHWLPVARYQVFVTVAHGFCSNSGTSQSLPLCVYPIEHNKSWQSQVYFCLPQVKGRELTA